MVSIFGLFGVPESTGCSVCGLVGVVGVSVDWLEDGVSPCAMGSFDIFPPCGVGGVK